MGSGFFEITLIICLATAMAIVFRIFKQPTILAYILTGILIGPFGNLQLQGGDQLQMLGQLGITLLLFMMGLELKFKEFKTLGPVVAVAAAGQIGITALLGYGVSMLMGFSSISSLYLAIALTFSSTIIIVKLLSDKRELNSLYGKISVGILLIQDFLAVILLMLLSSMTGSMDASSLIQNGVATILKGAGLVLGVGFLSRAFLPKIVHHFSKSSDVLFLFSISWVFLLAAIVSSPFIGFSIEIGGFLAGLALANSVENVQIAAHVRSLRDFFLTIFFVILGMQMNFESMQSVLFPAIILSIFVLIGKPAIVIGIMSLLGHRKRTAFLTGISLSQISEFSLVMAFLGNALGHVPDSIVAIITMVCVITFVFSSYLMKSAGALYSLFGKHLGMLERKGFAQQDDTLSEALKNHVVLVGAHRMGETILEALLEEGETVVVIDFNPDIAVRLKDKKVKNIFGDIADFEVQEKAGIENAKLLISTISDEDANLLIIQRIKKAKSRTKVIMMALDKETVKSLYKAGADYVVMPHLLGGKHLAQLIKKDALGELNKLKEKES